MLHPQCMTVSQAPVSCSPCPGSHNCAQAGEAHKGQTLPWPVKASTPSTQAQKAVRIGCTFVSSAQPAKPTKPPQFRPANPVSALGLAVVLATLGLVLSRSVGKRAPVLGNSFAAKGRFPLGTLARRELLGWPAADVRYLACRLTPAVAPAPHATTASPCAPARRSWSGWRRYRPQCRRRCPGEQCAGFHPSYAGSWQNGAIRCLATGSEG